MLSIVIPVLNESESLPQLHAEIGTVAAQENLDVELVFVDDGSTDDSWQVIEKLAEADPRVRAIRFRRNFGKAAALSAGLEMADGEFIMSMDADLQDDPAEIPRFLEKLAEGNDVVNGWKQRRLDPWHKVYPSKVFNYMVSKLTGLSLHDHNCGVKCFRSQVAQEIELYGELHRFVPVLAHAQGFRVAELPVNHRSREFGHSKYGVRRFLRGFLDLLTVKFLTGFGQRPQHMLGATGLLFFGIGGLGIAYLTLVWILTNVFEFGFGPIGGRPLLAYSIAFVLLGGQLMSLGFLAELVVANSPRSTRRYSIRERIAGDKQAAATEEAEGA
ncbi:Undecaprenyl-phosphate 4-deoxy-4-formamido-L-arabinose transferase [Symmachiella dynata]|uniref:glycosyltransferase family 2 protein n=1 Tax=Symmachiella dynata TaxID=2527995 RepID=UPI00118AEBFE|nr:glycosyltransferase family 2 protein [Symmachiella dynata]QDT50615.1 Undecaprenyl-phosphate 4-deoxy-4-formamido-L-arabinose transferase [Symmachiella dynata]